MIRIGSFAITIFALIVLLPPAARAACLQWDVTGGAGWHAVQSSGVAPLFTLEQNQIVLQGTAEYGRYNPTKDVVGAVNGTIQGNSFDVTIVWNDGGVAGYTGKVGSDGRLRGIAFNRRNPGDQVNWYSDVAFKCLTAAADAPPLPAKKLGRVVVPPGTAPLSHLPVCQAAKVARARNNPAAPGLEAQCAAYLAQPVEALPDDGSPARSH